MTAATEHRVCNLCGATIPREGGRVVCRDKAGSCDWKMDAIPNRVPEGATSYPARDPHPPTPEVAAAAERAKDAIREEFGHATRNRVDEDAQFLYDFAAALDDGHENVWDVRAPDRLRKIAERIDTEEMPAVTGRATRNRAAVDVVAQMIRAYEGKGIAAGVFAESIVAALEKDGYRIVR